MIAHNGATSLVANRTIGTKVAVGFAVVLLILAVSCVFAYLAFGQVAGTMGVYSGLVARSAIFRDIDRQVTQYRGHVREYVFSNDEATATVGVKDGDTLRQLIADGLTRVTHPERRRILEDTAKQADIYASNFERVRAANLEQSKLQSDVLDKLGPQITDAFTAMLAAGAKAENADLQRLAAQGRMLSLVARIDMEKRLGRHDEAAGKAAEKLFEDLGQTLIQLDTATKATDIASVVKNSGTLLERYQAASRRATNLDTEQLSLVSLAACCGRLAKPWPRTRSRHETATSPIRL